MKQNYKYLYLESSNFDVTRNFQNFLPYISYYKTLKRKLVILITYFINRERALERSTGSAFRFPGISLYPPASAGSRGEASGAGSGGRGKTPFKKSPAPEKQAWKVYRFLRASTPKENVDEAAKSVTASAARVFCSPPPRPGQHKSFSLLMIFV